MNHVPILNATNRGSKKQKQSLNPSYPRTSPSLMIFVAATAGDRWMGSMKMLAESEPEVVENLDSETMEKLRGQTLVKEQNRD